MAKMFIEYLLTLLLAVTLFTQVILPIFSKGIPFFWIFKKSLDNKDSSGVNSLDDLSKEAQESKDKMDSTKQKISSAEQTLNQIKQITQ